MLGDDQVALKWINHVENENNTHPPVTRKPERSSDEELLDAYSRAVIHVVEAVGPAVVSIRPRKTANRREPEETGSGSGVVIAPDGYILTNDQDVSSVDDLHRFLAEWPIGKAITLSVIRGKISKMLDVVPAEAAAYQLN